MDTLIRWSEPKMETIPRKELSALLRELVDLQISANLRSLMIVENGRRVSKETKMKAEAASMAYGYAILRLRSLGAFENDK